MVVGDVAYSGSRFIFWCVAPVAFLCGIGLPLMVDNWTPLNVIFVAAGSVTCFAAIFALYDARRFPWVARIVTGIIFLACLAYVVQQFFLSGKPLEPTRRSEPSPWNSVAAFFAFGLPSLWYTVLGRFSWQKPDPPAEEDEPDG